MGPVPAVAAIRLAVRNVLADHLPGDLVLVGCSGGADSLALACAAAFVAPRLGLRCGAVTVDHGLQDGSAERAAEVVLLLRQRGLDPVESVAVVVGRTGGPEAAARSARYEALDHFAGRLGARSVLLGHTRDDQAETVLLGLARGCPRRWPGPRGCCVRTLRHWTPGRNENCRSRRMPRVVWTPAPCCACPPRCGAG